MEYIKLGELADVIVSGVDKKTKDGETPVKLCNFVDVYYNWAVTSEMYDSFMDASARDAEIEKFSLSKGQVAITKDSETRFDIGIPTYIADDFKGVLLGYHCALITPNQEVLNGKYLNALLNSDYAKEYFANNATGSGQRYTISEETIKSLPIPRIPIEEQIKVGEYFSNIDRKIVNNKKQNELLKSLCKRLFEYWFIQFDFPNEEGEPYKESGGEMSYCEELKQYIPEGWTTVLLKDILDKVPSTKSFESKLYKKQAKFPIIDQSPVFIVGYTDDEDNILTKLPAIVFGDHSTNLKYVNFPFGRGADGTQIIYSKDNGISQIFLFHVLKSTSIPNPGYQRHFKYVKELYIIKPTSDLVNKFSEQAEQMYDLIKHNVFETVRLEQLKTRFMSMLTSGQVNIKEL